MGADWGNNFRIRRKISVKFKQLETTMMLTATPANRCLTGVPSMASLASIDWAPHVRAKIDDIKSKLESGEGPVGRHYCSLIGAAFAEKFAELIESGKSPTETLEFLQPTMDLWLMAIDQWSGVDSRAS
jgi:hypothetical protein